MLRSLAKENMRTADQARTNKRAVSGVSNRSAQPAGDYLDVLVVVEKPDYLICVHLDVVNSRPTTLLAVTDQSSANRDLVEVAKPVEFRRSHLEGLDRPNKDGEVLSYAYNDANGTDRTVTLTPSGGGDDITEDQVVNPPYIEEQTIDSTIYAGSYITVKTVRNGTGVQNDAGDDLYFVDVNLAGRAWAEKDAS